LNSTIFFTHCHCPRHHFCDVFPSASHTSSCPHPHYFPASINSFLTPSYSCFSTCHFLHYSIVPSVPTTAMFFLHRHPFLRYLTFLISPSHYFLVSLLTTTSDITTSDITTSDITTSDITTSDITTSSLTSRTRTGGDISYATGYMAVWDFFLNMISPIAGRTLYLTTVGNHESDYPNSGV
jgi:hypothetical protein